MNPREFLREGGYPIAVLTSYSFDPVFFERLVLPDLWAGGSGSVVVFVDRGELEHSLHTCIGRLRHLGRRYFLVPVDMPGAFHPKVFLRLGNEGGLAWIGSGNLTRGGWGSNSELAGAWQLGGPDADPGGWVTGLLSYLDSTLRPGLARDLLARAQRLEWLPDAPEPGTGPVLFSHDQTLAGQIDRRWAERKFTSVKILTGSTDRDAAMLKWTVERFGIQQVQICVTPERASFDVAALDQLDASIRFVDPPAEKPVHAKFYWFDGPEGAAAVWGSANSSRAAWLLEGHNMEAVVVEDRAAAAAFTHVLEIFEKDGLPAKEVLIPTPADLADTRAVAEPTYRILHATLDTSEAVTVEVEPALPEGAAARLEMGDFDLPLEGEGREWIGHCEAATADRYATIVRLSIKVPGSPPEWSSPHWIESTHQLREVLAGRDFRSTIEALRGFESRAADYRFAHELGRIGHELLHDASAYPDHWRSREKRKKETTDEERPPLDPAELLTSLGGANSERHPSTQASVAGGRVSGVFRALFARMDDVAVESEVIDEEDDGSTETRDPKQPAVVPRASLKGNEVDADTKAQKLLAKHMNRFFQEFEGEKFVAECTATQLAQATCYPIAVALMGGRRKWCSDQDSHAWVSRAVRGLLKRDRFHDRQAMLTLVQKRYEAEGRSDALLRAIGDGQLWLTLLVAIDALPGTTQEEVLVKLTLFRDLLERGELLAATDSARVMALFRDYYDPDAIELARTRADRLGGALRRVERSLAEHYDTLMSAQARQMNEHRHGDLVWSPKGGWGVVESDQSGDIVEAYVAQADDVRTFKAQGWLLNVSHLGKKSGASAAIQSDVTSFLKAVRGEAV